ncbi:MAG TPA: transcription elongation factor GreA [Anaerolineaceae bacterium]|jgi:transcription elongation factor GreA|nr:transcription elongation factor GreA [Anaerolineaceae bacterium]
MAEVHYLTTEGLEKLQRELENLKGPARQALSERLRFAIQQGDLSENADYIAAKEEQGFLEGRILELEQILQNAAIIDETRKTDGVITIGSRITYQEENFPPETYQLVGPAEANPARGRISHESPIGRALLGQRLGETVSVDTPGGAIRLKILKIE